jgi:hypothetical protein
MMEMADDYECHSKKFCYLQNLFGIPWAKLTFAITGFQTFAKGEIWNDALPPNYIKKRGIFNAPLFLFQTIIFSCSSLCSPRLNLSYANECEPG